MARKSSIALLAATAALSATLSWGQAQQQAPGPDNRTRIPQSVPKGDGPQAPPHDLGGPWTLKATPENRTFYNFTFSKDGPEMTPWALERFKQAKASNTGAYSLETTNDPVLRNCSPPGTPRVYFHPYPFEFIPMAKGMLMIYEYDHTIRRIYTDGRPVPEDPDLTWMGTSVGHWESDHVFVVETVGLNERTWTDRAGHPHSDQLRVTERFNRIDKDNLKINFIMTDPKAYVRPWISADFYAVHRPDWELGEISCSGDYLDFSKFEK